MRACWLSAVAVSIISVVACSRGKTTEDKPPATQTDLSPATAPQEREIKIGQTMPYSGPASAYSTIGKAQAAYFQKLNEEGGINGRKLKLLSFDDAYTPPKTVEQVRRLVEQDQVLMLFNAVGTAANSAVRGYLNSKKVPQLFVSTGATKWGDPEHFPWTIGFNPTYQLEGRTYAEHILRTRPKAKIAVLYQNDDYGKDLLKGLKDGLGEQHAKMIVSEVSYEISDATIDSQIVTLKGSKADTFVDITTPKFAAQAVRKIHDIGWKPTHYLNNVGASIGAVLIPASPEKAIGAMTISYYKDPTDAQYDGDPEMQRYKEFMKKYYPAGDLADAGNAYAYIAAQTLVQVLKQCENDLSRENVMKQATNLKNFRPELLLPGITINTSPTDFFPFDNVRISRFDGKNWIVQDSVDKG